MIAESATATSAPSPSGQRPAPSEPLSLQLVASKLQALLASRRAVRLAERAEGRPVARGDVAAAHTNREEEAA